MATNLREKLNRNPKGAESELIELARGTNNETTNKNRQNAIDSILVKGIPQTETTHHTSSTGVEPSISNSGETHLLPTQTDKAQLNLDQLPTNLRQQELRRRLTQSTFQNNEATNAEHPNGETSSEISTQKATEDTPPQEAAAQPTTELENAQLIKALEDAGNDPTQLSVDDEGKLRKFIKTQVDSMMSRKKQAETATTVATESAVTPKPEANDPTDAATAKDAAIALGVDPKSEAGVKLFDLIDSSTPDAIKGLWDKVTTAEGATELALKYFSENGLKGSLNPKNIFKFALGEIVAEQQTDTQDETEAGDGNKQDAQSETKTKVRSKIKALLAALAEALGIIALEAVKGEMEVVGSGMKN